MNRAMKRKEKQEARQRTKLLRRRQEAAAASASQSTQAPSGASLLGELPADKRGLLEQFDGFAPLRNGMRRIAEERGDWSGIPMPLKGERLIIEPHFPNGAALSVIGTPQDEDKDPPGAKLRNRWWSSRLRAEIMIWEENGKIEWGKLGRPHHIAMDLHTLGCADAWGIEQESNAVRLLATLVKHRQFKHYMLTGMFMETSKRSGLTYIFRRLKPTVVVDCRDADGKDTRILAALCMHPIAFYDQTWAGAMCPTDDVIAHLTMMRGDEHLYWRRANQHHPGRPEAGL